MSATLKNCLFTAVAPMRRPNGITSLPKRRGFWEVSSFLRFNYDTLSSQRVRARRKGCSDGGKHGSLALRVRAARTDRNCGS